jgi:adhesin/invasin
VEVDLDSFNGDSSALRALTNRAGTAVNSPAVLPGGVVSAATLDGDVSPGSIVTLFGVNLATAAASAQSTPLPTSLGGTFVSVNGTAAPLFYVSPSQINLQLPTGMAGNLTTTVTSENSTGVTTVAVVATESPAIFVIGGQQGAVLNQDFSLNSPSNPASIGSFVEVFATGLGATNPPLSAGQVGTSTGPYNVTVNPVTVLINGVGAPVAFAGAAPGFAGLFQINAVIPEATPAGSVSLQIQINGKSSNTVTIATK